MLFFTIYFGAIDLAKKKKLLCIVLYTKRKTVFAQEHIKKITKFLPWKKILKHWRLA